MVESPAARARIFGWTPTVRSVRLSFVSAARPPGLCMATVEVTGFCARNTYVGNAGCVGTSGDPGSTITVDAEWGRERDVKIVPNPLAEGCNMTATVDGVCSGRHAASC